MLTDLIKNSGIIIRSSQRIFDCKLPNGEIVSAKALGNLLKKDESLVAGDKVNLEKQANGEYVITTCQERTSEIFRVLPREKKKKVTAANVDIMIILVSSTLPAFKRGIVDRYLVRAAQWGIAPALVFNKMDEYDPLEGPDLLFESSRLKELGVKCFEISALKTNYKPRFLDQGFNELKKSLSGKMSIFLGQSGVGKSKIISALSGGKVELLTQELGRAGKGSHTTTWCEIIDGGDFLLVDSPGIRSFSIDDLFTEDFIEYFPDLEQHATKCKYPNCTHLEDAQGCFFLTLDRDKSPDREILSRLDSYIQLVEEISTTPDWQKK